MSVRLRREQECESEGCGKPAHLGGLCAPCFYAASPARRAVELGGCEDIKQGAAAARLARSARSRRAWDEQMQALLDGPAYGEVG